jgi:cardiolipin synthase
MKKIRDTLSSRYFTTAFLIFLVLVQLLTVFIILNRYSMIMTVLSYIFTACVILYVINKDELPEIKLPWLILFLVLPIVGAFIFILFNGTEQTKKIKKAFEDSEKMSSPYRQLEDSNVEIFKKLQKENIDAYLQANFISRVANMPCYDNSKVTYYRIGEDFHAALLREIKRAEHFIFMEYFMIEKGIMWDSILDILIEKAKQGVQINIMYDDFGCMKTLPQHYYKELTNVGIQCTPFNKFAPVLSQIHNNRDHRKITVIDGLVGFTGGINIMDEYINAKDKLGHWKDSAVKIEGKAVKNLTMLFLTSWNMQNKITLEYEPYLNADYPLFENVGTLIPYGDGPSLLYEGDIGRNIYLNMIYSAKKYLYITTPYLICDYSIMNALRSAAKKGVDVRIITPYIPDKKLILLLTRSNYELLIKDGIKIYEYTPGFMHAKNFVCDDVFAVCGTINMDYRSMLHHYECGVWIYNDNAVRDMKADFMDTMECSELITERTAKLTGFQKLIRNVMKVFFPLL